MKPTIVLTTLALATAVFAGPDTRPSPKAVDRAAFLNDHVESFSLDLAYRGDQDKPFYFLRLHVAPEDVLRSSAFALRVQIEPAEAKKLIDYLEHESFLGASDELERGGKPPAVETPCYTMTVSAESEVGRRQFFQSLGWKTDMIHRLDHLRSVLDGDSAKAMDTLLTRLSGLRREWSSEAH